MPTAIRKLVSSRARGLTLVELLVVVAIVTLLSALTLPTLRTVMTQRKSSQASILVKNMLEAARAKAIARGRPVAVILERISSRADRNPSFTSGSVISETNFPLRSNIASNTDFASNYDLYNMCIRMSFAESPAPILFTNVSFNLTGEFLTLNIAAANDARFSQAMRPGALVSFPTVPAISRQLEIREYIGQDGAGNLTYRVDNLPLFPIEYVSTRPTGYVTPDQYLIAMTAASHAVKPTIPPIPPLVPPLVQYPAFPNPANQFSALTSMEVVPLPQPVAAQVVDLPKGTCIDLSLSGLASDVRWFSSSESDQNVINLRDARRHFASDWIWPTIDPAPISLRPVYIVFGPTGSLDSVLMNDFTGRLGSVAINRYDIHDDIYLFVGRSDQILRVAPSATPEGLAVIQGGAPVSTIYPPDLESKNIKANINDTSSQWVRISPNSGAVSVATVASAYDTKVQGNTPTANSFTTIGEVIARSRSLSFTDEASAQ